MLSNFEILPWLKFSTEFDEPFKALQIIIKISIIVELKDTTTIVYSS